MRVLTQETPPPAFFVSLLVTHTQHCQTNSQQIPIIGTQIAHLRPFVLCQARIRGVAVAIAVLGENAYEIDNAAKGAEGDKGDADTVAGLISGITSVQKGTI